MNGGRIGQHSPVGRWIVGRPQFPHPWSVRAQVFTDYEGNAAVV